jgi:Cys-tRNA(Pro)/Cys-tRNA(Cys) deacylase
LTPAIKFLEAKKIAFEIAQYEHHQKGAQFASQAIGMPVEQTIKTLIVELSRMGYLVVLMPGSKRVSFKQLAKSRGAKRAAMVTTEMAERLTGYHVGGISPFGMKKSLKVGIDKDLMAFDRVAINGGARGIMLIMSPADIVEATGAEVLVL